MQSTSRRDLLKAAGAAAVIGHPPIANATASHSVGLSPDIAEASNAFWVAHKAQQDFYWGNDLGDMAVDDPRERAMFAEDYRLLHAAHNAVKALLATPAQTFADVAEKLRAYRADSVDFGAGPLDEEDAILITEEMARLVREQRS